MLKHSLLKQACKQGRAGSREPWAADGRPHSHRAVMVRLYCPCAEIQPLL